MKGFNKEKMIAKKHILEKCSNIRMLSKNSNINFFMLIYILYFPFSRIKLTHACRISKALGVSVSQLF